MGTLNCIPPYNLNGVTIRVGSKPNNIILLYHIA
uniref:Uncharacterized protein n=1 Tax=Anguilla anguilla TaxID=7936 RepID=A0A0E9VEZ0_ANGAN